MTNDNEDQLDDQTDQPDVEIVPVEGYLSSFAPNKTLQPYPLSDILKQMGLSGPRVPAVNLVDKTFSITGAKPFESSFGKGKHAYFCTCIEQESGEIFTTVLGGGAVVDIIDALANSEFGAPLLVTLRLVKGGRYGHYYTLE